MKRYFYGVKNILLILACLIPTARAILDPLVLDPLYIGHPAARNFVDMININPLTSIFAVYFGILALILFLSEDVWHCIMLNIIESAAMFSYMIISSGDSSFQNVGVLNSLVIVFLVLNVLAVIHGGAIMLKFLMIRKKRIKSEATFPTSTNADLIQP